MTSQGLCEEQIRRAFKAICHKSVKSNFCYFLLTLRHVFQSAQTAVRPPFQSAQTAVRPPSDRHFSLHRPSSDRHFSLHRPPSDRHFSLHRPPSDRHFESFQNEAKVHVGAILPLKPRIKSHLLFAGIISSPFSPR